MTTKWTPPSNPTIGRKYEYGNTIYTARKDGNDQIVWDAESTEQNAPGLDEHIADDTKHGGGGGGDGYGTYRALTHSEHLAAQFKLEATTSTTSLDCTIPSTVKMANGSTPSAYVVYFEPTNVSKSSIKYGATWATYSHPSDDPSKAILCWKSSHVYGPDGGVHVGKTPPDSFGAGKLWWDSDNATLYVYDGSAWVSSQVRPPTDGDSGSTITITDTEFHASGIPGIKNPISGSSGQAIIPARSDGRPHFTLSIGQNLLSEADAPCVTAMVVGLFGAGAASDGGGSGGGGASHLDALSDVQTTGTGHVPEDGQVLTWDAEMGHWMPKTPAQ